MAPARVHSVERAVNFDVDGVVSPVHGHTAWGDDVVAGHVFVPVYVSPTLCEQLDELATAPHVSFWWLTSWSVEMRAGMSPFPGRDWRVIAEQPLDILGRTWWKLTAVKAWLPAHPGVRAVAWCDDHLANGMRRAAVHRRLLDRGVGFLPIFPKTAVGFTPDHLATLRDWVS